MSSANLTRSSTPKILARSCQFCKARKIKCDNKRPACTSCIVQKKECKYDLKAPNARPSKSIIRGIQIKLDQAERLIQQLKAASPEARAELLESIPNGEVHQVDRQLSPSAPSGAGTWEESRQVSKHPHLTDEETVSSSDEEDGSVLPFLSIDERGKISGRFGPSSALHGAKKPPTRLGRPRVDQLRNQLIANAALQRQKEHDLRHLKNIDGVPIDLALSLLDLHWKRQHHTFLLTYRPAIMRDLITGGPYCSKFLMNAIFASSSKYSERVDVRDNPADPRSAGLRFMRRCDQLLAQESVFQQSSISSIVGLLLLGSTFNSRGETSKGWLYTGHALRMVYDLGLHLDCKETAENAEEIEIRRRVFWGAFICDKMQSLYLGRPAAIQVKDARVPRVFLDTLEEMEMWNFEAIPMSPEMSIQTPRTPLYSVTTFQHFCSLSRLMSRIINHFYVVGASPAKARKSLDQIDQALSNWHSNLPPELVFEPWSDDPTLSQRLAAPNVMNLHALYHSLLILLHRPFIADGHLRSTAPAASSWKRCTTAARHITKIVLSYQSANGLAAAPYLLSYSAYVACTIHVRNAAALDVSRRGETLNLLSATLRCLEELSKPNPGVTNTAKIIKELMAANGVPAEVAVDPVLTNETPSSLDLDAIFRMFPIPSSPGEDYLNPFLDTSSPARLNLSLPPDPLVGFMSDSMAAFYNPQEPYYDIGSNETSPMRNVESFGIS